MPFELRDDVSLVETEYGMVLLDGRTGEYWTLNPTAVLVMRTLLDGGDTDRAVHALVNEFDADVETAGADVADLVTDFAEAGLLKRTPGGPSPANR
jgi:hypothetical protein